MPAMEATIHDPGRGENHVLGGSSVSVKAGSEQTGGSFYCGEVELEPGFPGPPPHIHERLHDMFYVLDGTLAMRVGHEELEAPAGTFVCVPPGVVHTFSNPGPARVRFLNFNTPGGWERYMRELGAAGGEGRQLTSAQVGEIASRYDFCAVTLT
jgi:mannose-6-phosphate isomerase-like protein (cupin superfamily)